MSKTVLSVPTVTDRSEEMGFPAFAALFDDPDLLPRSGGALVPSRVGAGLPQRAEVWSPVPGSAPSGSRPVPCVVESLFDDRRVTVNGQPVKLPVGVGRRVTAAAFKVLTGLYEGLVLFLHGVGGARQLRDDDVIELHDGQQFGARPRMTAVPRHLTRD